MVERIRESVDAGVVLCEYFSPDEFIFVFEMSHVWKTDVQ